MIPSISSSILVAASYFLQGVQAGAGAHVHACVTYDDAPPEDTTVNFKAAVDWQCMNHFGSNANLKVSSSGTFCADIGYVELKASSSGGDLCATDKSYWSMTYGTTEGDTGYIKTQWKNSGYIYLVSPSSAISVCGSQSLCDDKERGWDGTGELWIHFQPKNAGKSWYEILIERYKRQMARLQNRGEL
ncbi:hypothetical protein QBC40DRAFT_316820 [Triangularia verruculosa]|uniref:Uncharacterized protein n=1 Tax=Triangularia verruculosa TaxID=2587418 RepID=A0AAN7ARQ4_9PEZI|nr:hypothetical protein QBC40DRAFT_316820 [Triangularia verruculosa]